MQEGLVRLGGVWKEIANNGDTYYSGELRPGVKMLIFRNKQKTPGSNQPDFEVFLKQYNKKSTTETIGEDSQDGEL